MRVEVGSLKLAVSAFFIGAFVRIRQIGQVGLWVLVR